LKSDKPEKGFGKNCQFNSSAAFFLQFLSCNYLKPSHAFAAIAWYKNSDPQTHFGWLQIDYTFELKRRNSKNI